MGDSPMKPLAEGKRFKLYYANRQRFASPGVHLWTGKRHVRAVPLPRAPLPAGACRECRHGVLFDCARCDRFGGIFGSRSRGKTRKD